MIKSVSNNVPVLKPHFKPEILCPILKFSAQSPPLTIPAPLRARRGG